MKNVEVQKYNEERIKEKENKLIASQDEVLQYLTSVLRGESESEIVVIEGIGDGCSEAKTMNKRPDEKERLKAGELLAKRYGLLSDKVNLLGEVDTTLNIKIDYGDE